jgi:enoyl-CoA hydratase/carnithine racemase
MVFTLIEVEKTGAIGIIRLISPEKLNPLDRKIGIEMASALDALEKEEQIRALIIIGTGRAFSAGGDVKGMMKSIEENMAEKYMDDQTEVLYGLASRIRRYPKPVIAAVNGYAIGAGMNLALSCDLIIASEDAKFSQSFCRVGLIPGFGGTYFLISQTTWQKAVEISFLGESIDSAEMKRIGLVNRVVPDDELEREALALAGKLAEGPTLAFARTKELFLDALSLGFEEHLKREREMQVKSALTEDYRIGVRAVNERIKAQFEGR